MPCSTGPDRFDRVRESPYDEPSWPTACGLRLCIDGCLAAVRLSPLLPPRSMVGQLTLDQHIGVRIPGGQPIRIKEFSSPNIRRHGSTQYRYLDATGRPGTIGEPIQRGQALLGNPFDLHDSYSHRFKESRVKQRRIACVSGSAFHPCTRKGHKSAKQGKGSARV